MGSIVIRHVLRLHRQVHGQWSTKFECMYLLDILMKQWVVAEVGAKAEEVFGIGKEIVIVMDNAHIPAHKTHLQAKDCRVATIVGQNEF